MQEVTVTAGIKDGSRMFEVVVTRGLLEQRRGFAAAKMREYARQQGLGSIALVSQANGPKRFRFCYAVEIGQGERLAPFLSSGLSWISSSGSVRVNDMHCKKRVQNRAVGLERKCWMIFATNP